MMSRTFPVDLLWAILQPIRQSHVTVGEIDRFDPGVLLWANGVILREDKANDFAELDVVEEELHVHRIGPVIGRLVGLVFDEVVLCKHLHVRVIDVDGAWSSECHSH